MWQGLNFSQEFKHPLNIWHSPTYYGQAPSVGENKEILIAELGFAIGISFTQSVAEHAMLA